MSKCYPLLFLFPSAIRQIGSMPSTITLIWEIVQKLFMLHCYKTSLTAAIVQKVVRKKEKKKKTGIKCPTAKGQAIRATHQELLTFYL